jgi:beta-glucosidase
VGDAQLATGESTTVEVTTDARLRRQWDTDAGNWGQPLTGGCLLVARGLSDIRANLPL